MTVEEAPLAEVEDLDFGPRVAEFMRSDLGADDAVTKPSAQRKHVRRPFLTGLVDGCLRQSRTH